jgi:cytosine/adenosine deaminase-related metal-dependent hydrolase
MSLLLIDNAKVLVTMDAERREIENGAIVVRDNVIEMLGSSGQVHRELSAQALQPQQTLDASGCILMPGLVNCHHHLYQTLTRSIGTAEGKSLFDWLQTLYPIWGQMDAEAVYISAKLGLAELMLSGATTVADHLYLFPNGACLDDEIRAARELGVRFHPTRGSMSLGQSQGGLPPDSVCEDEGDILADCERVISEFHDPERYSMLRIGLAPCSPFSVTPELLRKTADLARRHAGVYLHTHLAETIDENRFCEQQFGMRPVAYMQSLGWTGDDVWFAHMVHPDPTEIGVLAETRSGVCHCPSSNMILASSMVRRVTMVTSCSARRARRCYCSESAGPVSSPVPIVFRRARPSSLQPGAAQRCWGVTISVASKWARRLTWWPTGSMASSIPGQAVIWSPAC